MNRKRLFKYLFISLFLISTIVLSIFFFTNNNDLNQKEDYNRYVQELIDNKGSYDEKTIVLKQTTAAEAKALAKKYNAKLRINKNGSFATLTLPDDISLESIYLNEDNYEDLSSFSLDYFAKTSDVTQYEQSIDMPTYNGNDEYFTSQSYLKYINLSNTWNYYSGNSIKIAIVDTGIDTDHIEFAGKISVESYNATYDKVVKEYDNDWSLIEDVQGHGTSVAGVIAASVNNDGIVGIAPNVELLIIKAECDMDGNYYHTSDLVFGLYYAIEKDADVVNMSFGTTTNPFEDAAKLAVDNDTMCVASAGNNGSAVLNYPAADVNVIGVGALAEDSFELAEYSNYGENTDIVAPGTVFTTSIGGNYQTISGTSFSSPIVAASICLLREKEKNKEFKDVLELLYASSYDLGSLGQDFYYGYGALNVDALLLETRKTVTFNYLTDEIENTKQVFIYDNTLQNLPEPDRNYAVFDGWYYDIYCTDEVEYYIDTWTQDLTLYAKWENEDDSVPFTYVTLDDDTIEIRSYTGHRKYITIPDFINGKLVSSIGNFAFENENKLRLVNLPNGLKNIGISAFKNCNNLLSIDIPSEVISIGDEAFMNCIRLSSVGIANDSKLEDIGQTAFAYSGLNSFKVPRLVQKIDGSTFLGTSRLSKYSVASDNASFIAIDGVLFNSAATKIVAYPASKGNSYEIPNNVSIIGPYAFAFSKLTGIDFNNVTTIDIGAFYSSNLTTVTIKDDITTVSKYAFYMSENLKSVNIGRGISYIDKYVFEGTNISSILIPNNIYYIDSYAFSSCGLQSITFEENSNLSQIGNNAFTHTLLKEVSFPDSLLYIGAGAFCTINTLKTISLNDGLISIAGSAFLNSCKLTSITIPDSLLYIGDDAFACSGISTDVVIPENVIEIGAGVFSACTSLQNILVDEDNEFFTSLDGVLYSKDLTEIIQYPAGNTQTSYRLADNTLIINPATFFGAANLNIIVLDDNLQKIQDNAFYHCDNLGSITITENVTEIGKYAFSKTNNLVTISFANNSKLTRLSIYAFADSGIRYIEIPSNVNSISQYVFNNCKNLETITFKENSKVSSLSSNVFDGCKNLSTIAFEQGSSLTNIQAHAFEGLTSLRSINLGNTNLLELGNYAFRYCDNLENVVFPDTLKEIGRYAFCGCRSLSNIDIPNFVEFIGRYAFYDCDAISIYFKNESLPINLQENWDEGIGAYYIGVQDTFENEDFEYVKLLSSNIAITKYKGSNDSIDLTQIDFGGDITQIGGYAFYNSNIREIILPSTLTTIQRYSFSYSKLENITIPDNVTFIGRSAFYAAVDLEDISISETSKLSVIEKEAFAYTTSLQSIYISDEVKTIGSSIFEHSALSSIEFGENIELYEIPKSAFLASSLVSISIPESVNLIDNHAFEECNSLTSVTFNNQSDLQIMSHAFYSSALTSIDINENINYIGEYAFNGLRNLNAFNVDNDNQHYKSVNGVLFSKDGRRLISFPGNISGSYTIPNSVEILGFGAFENSKLTSVNFENNINLLTIGYRAFYNSKISSIAIPESVISIDYYAFALCDELVNVSFESDENLLGIYEGAFYLDRKLNNITLPSSIIEISDYAFYGCESLDHLPINGNSNILGIFDYAFAYTAIYELDLPVSLVDIGSYAFLGIKIKELTIPSENKDSLTIGLGAFEECEQLEIITLPFIGASLDEEELVWFGYIFGAGSSSSNNLFVPESLKTIVIEEGLTTLKPYQFYNLKNVEWIEFPSTIKYIYTLTFNAGPNFERPMTAKYELKNEIVILNDDGEQIEDIVNEFVNQNIIGTLKFAEGLKTTNGTFQNCHFLEGVEFPNGFEEIKGWSFSGCSSLRSIDIPNTQTTIEEYTFSNCIRLQTISLPSSLSTISSNQAFYEVPNFITFINKSDNHLSEDLIGAIRAYDVNPLIIEKDGTIIYPLSGVEQIITDGDFVYSYSELNGYRLISYMGTNDIVTLPENYQGNEYKLYNFIGGNIIVIPDNMTIITDHAFLNNSTITEVILPNSITRIEDYAFSYCRSLETIVIPDSVEYIGSQAFSFCDSLISIEIPNSVTSISDYAFCYCRNLKNIKLSNNITSIDIRAFSGCEQLTNVILPDNLMRIENGAFGGCLRLKSLTIPDSVVYINPEAFTGCNIDFDINNDNFNYVDGLLYNFDYTELIYVAEFVEEARLHKNVANIGTAFSSKMNLKKIIFDEESTVTSVSGTISSCNYLEEVVFVDSFEDIPDFSSCYCDHLKINIPNSMNSIDYAKFYYTYIDELTLHSNINYLEKDSFFSSIVNKIIFSGNEHYIFDNGIIYNSDRTAIIIADNSFTKVVIPASVEDIGQSFFRHKNLSSVTFEEGSHLEIIHNSAFANCPSLTYFDFPEGLRRIEGSPFSDCNNLRQITLPSTLEYLDKNAFSNAYVRIVYNNSDIEIPLTIDYDPEIGWLSYYALCLFDKYGHATYKYDNNVYPMEIHEENDFLYSIDNSTYTLLAYVGNEEIVTLPVQIDGHDYFLGNYIGGIKHLIVPEEFNGIGMGFDDTFYMVPGNLLESVTIYGNHSSLSFYGCINLSEINIIGTPINFNSDYYEHTAYWTNEENWNNGILVIGNGVAKADESIEYFYMPDSTKSIFNRAFDESKLLKFISADFTNIPQFTFSKCSNVESIEINDINNQLTYYFDYLNGPITLKNVIIKKGCTLEGVTQGHNKVILFNDIQGINIFVEEERISTQWDHDYPGWSNGNKVYYAGEWTKATFLNADGSIKSIDYYPNNQVIRQPYMPNINKGMYTEVFIGWDIDDDSVVDHIPATSINNIVAKAIYDTVETVYHVNYYGLNSELLYSQNYAYNDVIDLPNNPILEGYTFKGWKDYCQGIHVYDNYNFYSLWEHANGEHNYVHSIIEATCEHDGYDLYVCSDCGDEYKENIVPQLEHEFGDWIIDTEATCEHEGLKHRECTNCDYTEEETIPALVHNYHSVVIKEATCQEEGLISYECETCGHSYSEIISKLAHEYERVTVERDFVYQLIKYLPNALYGFDGETAFYYVCSECGHVQLCDDSVRTFSASVNNYKHNHELVEYEVIINPGVLHEGIRGRRCSICGKVFEAMPIAKLTEYTFDDPTYTWDNDYCIATRICIEDPEYFETERVKAVITITQEQDCTNPELVRYTATFENNAFEDQVLQDVQTKEALGHNYVFNRIEWTDFTAKAIYVCRNDNKHIQSFDCVITNEVTTASTCEEAGLRTYTASYDNHTSTKTEVIPSIGHNYVFNRIEWTDFTATAIYVCSNDNNHTQSFDCVITNEVTTAATCEEAGLRTYTASYDSHTSTKTEVIPSIGHNYVFNCIEWTDFTATAIYVCSNDNSHKEEHECAVTKEITTAATCEASGIRTYTATYDNHTSTKQEVLVAIGHNYVFDHIEWTDFTAKAIYVCSNDNNHTQSFDCVITNEVTTAATCEQTGIRTYTASYDNHTSTKTEDIPAIGHNYTDWLVVKETTYQEEGIMQRECLNCHDIETKTIEKLVDENVKAFKEAMKNANLDSYEELIQMIELYNTVKDKESISKQTLILQEAVDNYNNQVSQINDVSNKASNMALIMIGVFNALTLLSFAVLNAIRKENYL